MFDIFGCHRAPKPSAHPAGEMGVRSPEDKYVVYLSHADLQILDRVIGDWRCGGVVAKIRAQINAQLARGRKL